MSGGDMPQRHQLPAALEPLRERRAWVWWREEQRDGRSTKVPYCAPDRRAKADDFTTWARFDELPAPNEFAGLGIMLGGALQGVDLDACLTADGVLEGWAREVVERLNTYAEVSPSGRGLKLFFYGPAGESASLMFGEAVELAPGVSKRRELSYYTQKRFFTVTGRAWRDVPLRTITAEDARWLRDRIEQLREAERARRNLQKATTQKAAVAPQVRGDVHPELLQLIRDGAPEGRRSEQFHHAVRWCADCGLTVDAIVALLEQYPDGIAAKYRGRERTEVERCLSGYVPKAAPRQIAHYSANSIDDKREAQPVSQLATLAGVAWPEIDRLPEASPGSPGKFPFDALGPIMGAAAQAVARDVQVPDSLAAGSVLAAASLASHAHADVLLPHGQRAPLSLFVVTGAESGDRKSAADQVVLREVEEVRREQARVYLRQKAAIVEQKGEAPPVARSLIVGKATVEGLQHILRTQSCVGLFTSEGGELLGGHSLREERRVAGLAWLLKAWGGETLDALTRGDGLSVLLGRRVAMHAMVQPVLLRSLLADPLARGQGLLARCLIAEPETIAGTRLFRGVRADDDEAVQKFQARMRHLLRKPPRTFDGGDGCELQPMLLTMQPAARALWIEFYNEVERQQAAGGELERARAFGSKACEHAARIAAIVQMMNDPESCTVSADAMDAGMAAAAFYVAEHVRLTGAGRVARRLAMLHLLLDWLRERRRGQPVPHSEVLQSVTRPVRELKAEGINALLDELAQRGYIRRAGDTWEVNPSA
jgi:hypothetical protein